jgi:hypothetical protein
MATRQVCRRDPPCSRPREVVSNLAFLPDTGTHSGRTSQRGAPIFIASLIALRERHRDLPLRTGIAGRPTETSSRRTASRIVGRHFVVTNTYMVAMAKLSMTLDLITTLDIIDDDVSAVVDAYLADPTSRTVAFGEGDRINPAAAVASHPFARTLTGQPWADEALRRAAVRAAILLAEPERI